MQKISMYFVIFIIGPIRIGFEKTAYTVDESVGTFDVYVKVLDPANNVELPVSIDLTIDTMAGTAGK